MIYIFLFKFLAFEQTFLSIEYFFSLLLNLTSSFPSHIKVPEKKASFCCWLLSNIIMDFKILALMIEHLKRDLDIVYINKEKDR